MPYVSYFIPYRCLGKSLDRSCPMGPCIVPADELDASDLTIKLWLNGELKQNSRTSKMIFQIPAIIENLSAGMFGMSFSYCLQMYPSHHPDSHPTLTWLSPGQPYPNPFPETHHVHLSRLELTLTLI